VHPRISVTGDAKFSPRQLSIFLKPAIFSFGDHSSIANYIYIYIYIYIYSVGRKFAHALAVIFIAISTGVKSAPRRGGNNRRPE